MTRLCVPVSGNNAIRLTVLLEAHDAYMHQGVDKTYRRLHAGYYWPTMTKDVQRYVNSCESCRRMKSKTHAEEGAISGHQVPDQRWDILHMDFITDLQSTEEGFDSILVCTDRLSRYSYLIPTKKTDTSVSAPDHGSDYYEYSELREHTFGNYAVNPYLVIPNIYQN